MITIGKLDDLYVNFTKRMRWTYKLALRDHREMFLIRDIVFSHETVRDRETNLTPALAESLRRRRRDKAGRSWYAEETYLKVQGHWR